MSNDSCLFRTQAQLAAVRAHRDGQNWIERSGAVWDTVIRSQKDASLTIIVLEPILLATSKILVLCQGSLSSNIMIKILRLIRDTNVSDGDIQDRLQVLGIKNGSYRFDR